MASTAAQSTTPCLKCGEEDSDSAVDVGAMEEDTVKRAFDDISRSFSSDDACAARVQRIQARLPALR